MGYRVYSKKVFLWLVGSSWDVLGLELEGKEALREVGIYLVFSGYLGRGGDSWFGFSGLVVSIIFNLRLLGRFCLVFLVYFLNCFF